MKIIAVDDDDELCDTHWDSDGFKNLRGEKL